MEGIYEPKFYRIRIMGHLDKSWEEWFNGMSIHYEGNFSVLEGEIKDNSSLNSILNRIYDLNLTILFLEQTQINSPGHTNSNKEL